MLLASSSRGVARTRATRAQARASADPSIIHTGLDYSLNLIVTYRHSGAANRQYNSTKNHPILSAVHNSKTLNKLCNLCSVPAMALLGYSKGFSLDCGIQV